MVLQTLARIPREPTELLAAIGEAIRPHRPQEAFATTQEWVQYEDGFGETGGAVEDLRCTWRNEA